MVKIIFDSNSSSWCKDLEFNRFFIWRVIEHILGILNHRGYIYLNQIYELFGVEWNPDDENICYRDPDIFHINFKAEDDDKIIITID